MSLTTKKHTNRTCIVTNHVKYTTCVVKGSVQPNRKIVSVERQSSSPRCHVISADEAY